MAILILIPDLLVIFFFFFAAALPSSLCLSNDGQYDNCTSPLRCGMESLMSPNHTYPFWGDQIGRPDFCGNPQFELTCKDDKIPTLQIRNLTLQLISVDQEQHIIRVTDEKGRCPGPEILNFKSDDKYAIYIANEMNNVFNCSPSPTHQLPPFSSSITCEGSLEKNGTYYVLDPVSDAEINSVYPTCKRVGDIPMLGSVTSEIGNQSLEEALKQGFDLKYKFEVDICQGCTKSDGICGSDSHTNLFRCLCKDKPHKLTCGTKDDQGNTSTQGQTNVINHGSPPTATRISDKAKLAIGIACGIVGFIVLGGGSLIIIYRVLASRQKKTQTFYRPSKDDLVAIQSLKQYNYSELKKITSSFAHIIGRGGFGIVYQGKLVDGRKVAVKVLKASDSNGEDFINEVISISQTSHINIVSLLGFCYQRSNRALVYEFVENGTLDQFISSNSLNRDMHTLYGIALGIDRGLEYLHYGCKTRIVHFDIKPQNVLLDNDLCPKISDFGLAKICERRESIMSSINTRGTIGYIAPEICSRMFGEVSYKADVYSYGMLIVVMIGAKNKERLANTASSSSSPTFFPQWMYENVVNGEYQRILGNDEIREKEDDVGKKMILVSLWCIQSHPSDRPSMDKVVKMMEGNSDSIEIPPKYFLMEPSTSSLLESSNEYSDSTFATRETKSSNFVP